MLRRALAVGIVLLLLLTSCSSSGDDDENGVEPERDRPEASILPPAVPPGDGLPGEEAAEENPDDGRLVVQHSDFQLSTMLPDGSEAAPLTDPGTRNTQPSWAPDGSRVAWVAVDESTGLTSIATDRFDRSDYRAVDVDETPYYLYWDPSAARIAHLSQSDAGIDLSVAEPFAEEDTEPNRRIDRGEPYFLSWGPDGDEILVHASGFRLDRIDLGSATIIVDEFPADFGAAAWLEDDSLVFADIEGDDQFLVTTGSSGEGRRPLITYDGVIRFAVSNQGNRVVFQAAPSDIENPVVTASTEGRTPPEGTLLGQPEPTPTPEFDDSLDAIDPIEQRVPYVMGTFGGEPFPLSRNPALALFPSPDGQSVAWIEASPVGDQTAVSLHVDTGGSTIVTAPFIPSDAMRDDYLPLFDQYSLSHDFWSPSSRLFVYAGRPLNSNEPDGIYIIDRDTGATTRIADGVVASFTRTPAAAGAASAL